MVVAVPSPESRVPSPVTLMRVTAQPAIVLHARRWRESSLLVELFTQDHGRVGVIARGTQGPKRQPLRAALQPLQTIQVDYLQRGELATLMQAEAVDGPPRLAGDALLAALYLAELTLRLVPRNDAATTLFQRFGEALRGLGGSPGALHGGAGQTAALAWTLRRYERDLIDALGYALPLDLDVDGERIDPAARYTIDPEHGPRRCASITSASADQSRISGAALLALARDTQPADDLLREQRIALRAVIAFHLGTRGLRSWGLMGEFARLLSPAVHAAHAGSLATDTPDDAASTS
jgi:DNA repair protein RecO (recombination protein O)